MAYTGPKKFSKKVKTKSGRKTVRYGAKGYSISPRPRRATATVRSAGQMRKPESSQEPQLALRSHTKKWK